MNGWSGNPVCCTELTDMCMYNYDARIEWMGIISFVLQAQAQIKLKINSVDRRGSEACGMVD